MVDGGLPELVVLGTVLKSCLCKCADEGLLVKVKVVTQGVERRVAVAQFHVDEAVEHHRVFGKFHVVSNV